MLLNFAKGCQILDLQSFPHPSWPKAMFSSILELSSLSSWVMWHHFSLEHRTQFESHFKSSDSRSSSGRTQVGVEKCWPSASSWLSKGDGAKSKKSFPLFISRMSLTILESCRKLYIFLKNEQSLWFTLLQRFWKLLMKRHLITLSIYSVDGTCTFFLAKVLVILWLGCNWGCNATLHLHPQQMEEII